MKNNKNILIGVAVLVTILIVGGIFLVTRKAAPTQTAQIQQEQVVATLKPEEVGLSLAMGAAGKTVVMKVAKTSDVASVDYELSYTSTGDIPRGAIGHIDVKTAGKAITQEITLGTCSDVCHYDVDVSNIKLVLKVTKTDGNIFQVEQTLQ